MMSSNPIRAAIMALFGALFALCAESSEEAAKAIGLYVVGQIVIPGNQSTVQGTRMYAEGEVCISASPRLASYVPSVSIILNETVSLNPVEFPLFVPGITPQCENPLRGWRAPIELAYLPGGWHLLELYVDGVLTDATEFFKL